MRVEVFDPPLCCPTGVCGPSVDPDLVRFGADLVWLSKQGVGFDRFNLAQQPQAFAANSQVASLLSRSGVAALPLVLCDGKVLTSGSYPSRETLATATGLTEAVPKAPVHTGLRVIRSKCEPGSGCC
ncbi:MAG TPA: arsenite efflux transporter metallochaperone ArsD [Thermoanaerobaculia bacterium]|nr:arsenite efflux transporter metallochaperone ArsD [Thermoanaerobaculia bacterium]